MFTVRQSVENTTGAPVALFPYGVVSRTGLPQTAGYYILHEGLIGYLGEEGLQEVDYGDLDDTPVDHAGEGRRRLARHHRQVLGRGADPADGTAVPAALPQGRRRRGADLSGGFPRRCRVGPGRRHGGAADAPLRRRQGNGAARRLRGKAAASRASSC